MNLPIKYEVPQLPQLIEIQSNWIDIRENILFRAEALKAVSSQAEYNDAEIILKAITKHSNDLEKHRKELAKPFQAVDKKIKALADEAREKLE
jgi:predicted transcriptional regulator